MRALHFLVDSLLTIYLYVLLLRFFMQVVRADFRNQLANAIVLVTNPVIMPLRRILPSIGKIDTANVVAILLFCVLIVGVSALMLNNVVLDPVTWITLAGLLLLRSVIMFFMFTIIVYALLGWVVPAGYNPTMALLGSVVEPVLRPFRRIIPPIAGIDLSPLWATLLLGVLLRVFGFA